MGEILIKGFQFLVGLLVVSVFGIVLVGIEMALGMAKETRMNRLQANVQCDDKGFVVLVTPKEVFQVTDRFGRNLTCARS